MNGLTSVYKSFIKSHLDYGNIVYDQESTASFHQKLESIQCNLLLALTGTMRGTSTKNVYLGLNLETLEKKMPQEIVLLP